MGHLQLGGGSNFSVHLAQRSYSASGCVAKRLYSAKHHPALRSNFLATGPRRYPIQATLSNPRSRRSRPPMLECKRGWLIRSNYEAAVSQHDLAVGVL